MGKSRGGLSTKIHAAVDALGNPLRLLLTEGQASEYGQADALIDGFQADYVLADKGYDSDHFVGIILENGNYSALSKTNAGSSPRKSIFRASQGPTPCLRQVIR